jgi:enoyl-CoA hydratase/carnithine racemase
MKQELVLFEKKDTYAVITLNQPDKLNALSPELLKQLEKILDKSDEFKVVVVRGAGRAFCAGADIKAFNTMNDSEVSSYIYQMSELFLSLRKRPPIFLAEVSGYAIGGGAELMLSCDLAYASEQARIGFPEVSLGLIPGATGTVRLARLLGAQKAKELLIKGNLFSAPQAKELRLVTDVIQGDVAQYVEHVALHLVKKSGDALHAIKSVVESSVSDTFAEAINKERKAFVECFATDESRQARLDFEKKN